MPLELKSLSLAEARRVIAAGEVAAEKIGLPFNLAVVDAGGNLVCQVRMDGGWMGSVGLAADKAWTARAFDVDTANLAELSQPGQPLFGINSASGGKISVVGGGLPLRIDGVVVGAVGASGGTAQQDREVAAAAASALDPGHR